jgi:hypothetical protein
VKTHFARNGCSLTKSANSPYWNLILRSLKLKCDYLLFLENLKTSM